MLYDLEPTMISFHLGSIGLQNNNLFSEYTLITKRGHSIKDREFLVSLFRHIEKPLNFRIIAINFEHGEEFALDLEEHDLLMLSNNDIVGL